VIDDESKDGDLEMVMSARSDEPGGDWTEWVWWNEEGSWFHRQGYAYVKEWIVICNIKENTDGRARVTTDEKWVLSGWLLVRTLQVSDMSLYSMHSLILSQCKYLRMDVISEN